MSDNALKCPVSGLNKSRNDCWQNTDCVVKSLEHLYWVEPYQAPILKLENFKDKIKIN